MAPRCRLITSWGWSRSQGYGCSPFKAVRELGSERRETVAATDSLRPLRPSSAREYNLSGHTFFRSYGVNLPSSFTRGLSSAWEFSSCPPVSVWGTVMIRLKLRDFSWKRRFTYFSSVEDRHHALALTLRICLKSLPTRLHRDVQHPDTLPFSVLPSHRTTVSEY